jgi:hypothetical protein
VGDQPQERHLKDILGVGRPQSVGPGDSPYAVAVPCHQGVPRRLVTIARSGNQLIVVPLAPSHGEEW